MEQTALFSWATWQEQLYPDLKWMYHVPNGGHRNKATAARLKAAGVKAGVPDVVLPAPKGIYHGLYIEGCRISNSSVLQLRRGHRGNSGLP
jgi:hypothetical protein